MAHGGEGTERKHFVPLPAPTLTPGISQSLTPGISQSLTPSISQSLTCPAYGGHLGEPGGIRGSVQDQQVLHRAVSVEVDLVSSHHCLEPVRGGQVCVR